MKTKRLSAALVAAVLAGGSLPLSPVMSHNVPAAHATGTTDPNLEQTVTEDEELAEEKVTRSSGHVDIGPRVADSGVELVARDDTQAPPVWRHLDDTVLHVVDQGAKIPMPDDDQYSFIPAEPGQDLWVIPQVEQPGVVWLGWNTQNPAFVNQVTGNVTLSLEGVQGPGELVVYLQNGGFGAPMIVWDKDQRETEVELNTHTHANWVFTQPGEYLVELGFSATTKDGSTLSDKRIVRLAVGDGANLDNAANMQFSGEQSGGGQAGGEQNAEQQSAQQSGADANPLLFIGGGIAAVLLVGVGAAVVMNTQAKKRARKEAEKA